MNSSREAKIAGYGEELVARLAADLTARFGRGFGAVNLSQMKRFYLLWQKHAILQTPSEKSSGESIQTLSEESPKQPRFPLPWSHYVRLMAVKSETARRFYETEALRGGWSVRQLDRQIDTVFYERTALSRDKSAMLTKGAKARPEDRVIADEEVKDPLVLEFLNLKDEYSESDLEEALLRHLEKFLLELGGNFAFVGRQATTAVNRGGVVSPRSRVFPSEAPSPDRSRLEDWQADPRRCRTDAHVPERCA